ncbi:claret isoform a [Anaeramoeba ignava]|uniref:Claret isoform a n=1 Tax=Anaeramoeba ignava TaxID=1746090 RepID=A0A9Q0RC01_ANAIG|nr:claret isoform a [Anaeramoeba ignava]
MTSKINEVWIFGNQELFGFGGRPRIHGLPRRMENVEQVPIREISANSSSSIFVYQDDRAIEYLQKVKRARKIQFENIKKAVSGNLSFGVLTLDGNVFVKGKIIHSEQKESFIKVNDMIEDEDDRIIKDVICGMNSIYMLSEKNTAYGFGNNNYGQLCCERSENKNKVVLMMKNVLKIYSGNSANHVFLLNSNQELFCCGHNYDYQFGLGKTNKFDISKPTKIKNIPKGKIFDIQSGRRHVIMLIENKKGVRKVYSCGSMLYNGHGTDKTKFSEIKSVLKKENVAEIAVGYDHSLILTSSGKLFGFGDNGNGQLANENHGNAPKPFKIELPHLGFNISTYHICAGSQISFLYTCVYSSLNLDLIQLFRRKEFCDIFFNTITGERIPLSKLILQFRIQKEEDLGKIEQIISKKTVEQANQIIEVIYGNYKIDFKLKREIQEYLRKENLVETMKRMYLSEETKDFIIKRNEKSFKFHKLVLIARSELFRGMFLSVTDDNSNQVSDYSELSDESFAILEYYLYTNQIKEEIQITEEIVEEMKKAMDYFQLNESNPNLVDLIKDQKMKN